MSNGVIKNCALGICCPPPAQVGALAQIISEISMEKLAGRDEEPSEEAHERVCYAIASGLIERGMIGLPIGQLFGEWARMAAGPSGGGAASANAGPGAQE